MRLIRPLSRDAVPKTRLAASHWQIATEEEFTTLWLKELQEIPPTRASEIHLVIRTPAARLETSAARDQQSLPASNRRWRTHRRTPHSSCRRADSARGVQSRRRCYAFRRTTRCAMLLEEGRPVSLRGGLWLRVSSVMGAKRIELTGFCDTEVEQLKSFGFFSRNYHLAAAAVSAAGGETGIDVFSRLFLFYPPL